MLCFNHSIVTLLVRTPFLWAEEECRSPSMVVRLQSMGEEWKKTMRIRKGKQNPTGENDRRSTALERRQEKPSVHTAGAARTTGEHCLVLGADKTGRAPGPSPKCSCIWAVIQRDLWGAVNISIYKTWNWKPLVYYFTQCFSRGNIPLKNLFSLVCHSVIIWYYFYEAFGHRIMQYLCKHFSVFFVNMWVEHVGIFSSLPPLLTSHWLKFII